MLDSLSSIDVHCHIFNGRDLPIDGFLRKVVFTDYPGLGNLLEPLIFLLSRIMQDSAPTAKDELTALDHIASGRAMPEEYAHSAERQREIVVSALRKLLARKTASAPRRGSSKSVIPFQQCFALVDLLHFRATRGQRFPDKFNDYDLQRLASILLLGGEDILQFVPWAHIFSNYRFIILDQLAHLAKANEEIALYVPAMVDYDYEIDDFSGTSQQDQIKVMEKISSSKNRPYAMHGYAAYDPVRHFLTNGVSFEIVQKAISQRGFIGVKIYPTMGFLPIGNAGRTFSYSRKKKSKAVVSIPGEQLDRVLIKFYNWCIKEDVPILTHCGCSNYSSPQFKSYGSPAHWQEVLDYSGSGKQPYRALRLSLGHFGGLPEYGKSGDSKCWLPTALDMIASGDYPNLYGDISYDSILLERDRIEQCYDETLMCFLKQSWKRPHVAQKIMFGSDWSMLGMEFGNERFYSAVKERFGSLLGADELLVALLKGNAAEFLGLAYKDHAKTRNRLRLEGFYSHNGVDPVIIDKYRLTHR